jgi:biopolymer transport protein ExbD/biopolymer transport protein TolR
MSVGGSGGLQSDINVTPMVDVMLVLLIIFMVITPLLSSGVNVILPKADYPEEDLNINKESAVVVSIPDAGNYYVGRELFIDRNLLVQNIGKKMQALKPGDPQVVYIRSGLNVPYGEVVKVVDAIRDAGFEQVGLIAEKNKKK